MEESLGERERGGKLRVGIEEKKWEKELNRVGREWNGGGEELKRVGGREFSLQ